MLVKGARDAWNMKSPATPLFVQQFLDYSKKIWKFCVMALYGPSGVFFSQMTRNVESVSIAWHHHESSCSGALSSRNSLKRKCRPFDGIFVNDTGDCHFDNFWCSHWWKFHQNVNISVSVIFFPIAIQTQEISVSFQLSSDFKWCDHCTNLLMTTAPVPFANVD